MANSLASIEVRALGPDDAAAFRERRLEALRDRPDAFGSSYEEENVLSVDDFRARFESQWNARDNVVFGAFREGELIGTAGVRREVGLKHRHKMLLWGVYVRPSARGLGVGRLLVEAAIARARELGDVAQVGLTMEHGNLAAQKTYESCGFVRWGTQPDSLRVDGRSVAEDNMAVAIEPLRF